MILSIIVGIATVLLKLFFSTKIAIIFVLIVSYLLAGLYLIIETNDDYLESPLVLMKACNGDGKSIIYVLLLWWLIIFEYFDRKIFISLVAIIEKLLISKLAIAVIISSKIEKGLRFNIIQVAINLILIYIAFFFLDAFVCEVVKRQKEKRFREVS